MSRMQREFLRRGVKWNPFLERREQGKENSRQHHTFHFSSHAKPAIQISPLSEYSPRPRLPDQLHLHLLSAEHEHDAYLTGLALSVLHLLLLLRVADCWNVSGSWPSWKCKNVKKCFFADSGSNIPPLPSPTDRFRKCRKCHKSLWLLYGIAP